MHVKKFEAYTMKDALSKVKKEMGSQAIIISTRKGNGHAGGVLGRHVIEVTAAIDDDMPVKSRPVLKKTLPEYQSYGRDISSHSKEWTQIEKLSELLEPLKKDIDDIRSVLASSDKKDEDLSLRNGIEEMRSMMSHLMKHSTLEDTDGIEREYKPYYLALVSSGIREKSAAEIISEVQSRISTGDVETDGSGPEMITICLAKVIMEKIAVSGPIENTNGSQRIVAFVGPTGVGKTTTLAKIAADLVFREYDVGLITIDTFRIAAAEQLKISANIIGAPVEIVENPEELSGVIRCMKEKDVILIDTAGRSHMDTGQIRELVSYFSNGSIERHLVINAGMDERNIDRAINSFSSNMEIHHLLFTKLDETISYGALYNQMKEKSIPLSYLTMGQKVPEDIEKATPERIASLILNPGNGGKEN